MSCTVKNSCTMCHLRCMLYAVSCAHRCTTVSLLMRSRYAYLEPTRCSGSEVGTAQHDSPAQVYTTACRQQVDNDQSLPTAIQLTTYMLTETGEYHTIKLQTKHAKAKLSWAIHSSMPRHEGSQADSIPGTTVEVCPGCPGCADPCSTPSASHWSCLRAMKL